jgi:hypothetical protein
VCQNLYLEQTILIEFSGIPTRMVRPCVAREFVDLCDSGLVCNVSGLWLERFRSRAIMDISARAASLADIGGCPRYATCIRGDFLPKADCDGQSDF